MHLLTLIVKNWELMKRFITLFLAEILAENETEEELKDAIKRNVHELIPKHITKEDIFATIQLLYEY